MLTVLAMQSALALSFDPRYRDFPFAPLTAAALPFLLLSFLVRPAVRDSRMRVPGAWFRPFLENYTVDASIFWKGFLSSVTGSFL